MNINMNTNGIQTEYKTNTTLTKTLNTQIIQHDDNTKRIQYDYNMNTKRIQKEHTKRNTL